MNTLNNTKGGIQLPDDARAVGYVKCRPFHHEQEFESLSANFRGTAAQFIAAGHAYRFTQNGFRRQTINPAGS